MSSDFPIVQHREGDDEAQPGLHLRHEGFELSELVHDMAGELIDRHGRLGQLDGWRIAYMIEHGDPPAQGAKHAWAKTRMIPRWLEALCPWDAAITINAHVWNGINQRQREALLLHELCHLEVDDKGRLGVVGHDVEEFGFVAATYGQWRPSLERFAEQLSMALPHG